MRLHAVRGTSVAAAGIVRLPAYIRKPQRRGVCALPSAWAQCLQDSLAASHRFCCILRG
jgi:hypothetical protein